MKRKPTVLICDDEKTFHIGIKQALREEAEVRTAYNCDEALAILQNHSVDILVLDIQMRTPEEGLDFLPRFRALDRDLVIIMNTSVADFGVLRRAFKLGANDYLVKDAESEAILFTVLQAVERRELLVRSDQHQFETSLQQNHYNLLGTSAAISEVRHLIDRFRGQSAHVILQGETGVGKEVVARALRKQFADGSWEPFIAIDSATIQASTAESILFGYEKGAFTGADRQQKGVFEEANGGVVYFDEIANMPLEIQNKLLRVIQEKEVLRLGSSKPIQLSFRVICATNRDLKALCAEGLFKDDLYQRIHVLPIQIPPLRERRDDIPEFCRHFARNIARSNGPLGKPLHLSIEALKNLMAYDWPGNVRELSNVMSYVAAMALSEEIQVADLPAYLRLVHVKPTNAGAEAGTGSFYDRVAEFEKTLLAREFAQAGENVSQLAIRLNMDRSHLHGKLKEYGITKNSASKRSTG